ncbi:MAG: hypothetical protein K6A64_07215 [Bacteroidales bacterium]|nr:hypothetical protein [Bacteroidales bacterium]
MRRKLIFLPAAALALLCATVCGRMEKPAAGTVTLNFRIGVPATRAETPGDGNVADGGGIFCTKEGETVVPDLEIFIFDENGALKRHFPDLDPDLTGTVGESDYAEGKATRLSVSFEFAEEGTFSVYALANTQGEGSNLQLPGWSGITNISQLKDLSLSLTSDALTGDPNASPVTGTRMPLSAQGTLHVSKGLYGKYNGLVELEMLRCIAKVQLSFRNLTGESLSLYHCQVTFHDMNALVGWLFRKDPDFVALDGCYRDFTTPALDLVGIQAADDPATPDTDEQTTLPGGGPAASAPVKFFPSVARMQTAPSSGKRYLCDISFRLEKTGQTYDADNPATYETKSFTNLPVHDAESADILALRRNQYLHIETTVSKNPDISFNFIVKNWVEHPETVFFN